MCKLIEDLQEEAKKETLLDNVRSLMETMQWTAQQAMNALKVPIDKQEEYVALIQATEFDGGQIFYDVQCFQADRYRTQD